jgi:two-component system chemotaxis response regulator CheB
VRWLASGPRIRVVEATPGAHLEPGTAHVVVRGPHIVVAQRGWLEACHDEPRDGNQPSIDVLFESVAASFGGAALGALLTGMGRDGARGLLRLREAGGVTIAQDQVTSSVFGMPRMALELGAAELVVARQDLAEVVAHLVGGPRAGRAGA